jgi:LPXTG-motif cell wall-anchored protein
VIPTTPTLTETVTISATTFKFGFSAATGWYTLDNELRGLVIRPAGAELASLGTSAATGSGTGPTSGGTLLTITGTGINASATVEVDGQPCTNVVVSNNGTQLTCSTPAGSPGIAQVVVTNPNGGPGYGTFTYVNPTPTVSAVNPASGTPDGGNTVTIIGNNFIAGATATLGAQTCANPVVTSPTTLTCVAPPGNDGDVVDAVVTNPGPVAGTGAELYTYSTTSGQAPSTQPGTQPIIPTPTTLAPRPPVTVPRSPIPANVTTGALPALTPGNSMVTEDGRPREVEVVVEDRTDLVMRGQDFVLRLRGECTDGCEVTTDATGRETIELETDGAARVSGEGFLPDTPVYVWLFSEPTFLGEFTVAADGTFTGRVPLTGIAAGTHTLQVNGTSFDGVMRSANLGVIVTEPNATAPIDALLPSTGANGSMASAWALVILALGGLLLIARRGRRQGLTTV